MTIGIIIVVVIILFLIIGGGGNVKHKKKQYGVTSTTLKGEQVKSKSEKVVADVLTKHNVQYIYEHPLKIHGKVVAHPDFYLPKYDTYIEFRGLLDKQDYKNTALFKGQQYKKHGIKFIGLQGKDIRDPVKKKFDEKKTRNTIVHRMKKL